MARSYRGKRSQKGNKSLLSKYAYVNPYMPRVLCIYMLVWYSSRGLPELFLVIEGYWLLYRSSGSGISVMSLVLQVYSRIE